MWGKMWTMFCLHVLSSLPSFAGFGENVYSFKTSECFETHSFKDKSGMGISLLIRWFNNLGFLVEQCPLTKRGVVWWAVGRQGVVGTSTTGGQDVGSPNLAEPSHLVSHQAHTWHPSLLCQALTGHNLFWKCIRGSLYAQNCSAFWLEGKW